MKTKQGREVELKKLGKVRSSEEDPGLVGEPRGAEVAEIRSNEALMKRLRAGSHQAKKRRGQFVE